MRQIPTASTFIEKVKKGMLKKPSAIKIRLNIHLLETFKTRDADERIALDAYAEQLIFPLLNSIKKEIKTIATKERGLQLQLLLNSIDIPSEKIAKTYGKIAVKTSQCSRSKRGLFSGLNIVARGTRYVLIMNHPRKPHRKKALIEYHL